MIKKKIKAKGSTATQLFWPRFWDEAAKYYTLYFKQSISVCICNYNAYFTYILWLYFEEEYNKNKME